jgi:hypothetical protein
MQEGQQSAQTLQMVAILANGGGQLDVIAGDTAVLKRLADSQNLCEHHSKVIWTNRFARRVGGEQQLD